MTMTPVASLGVMLAAQRPSQHQRQAPGAGLAQVPASLNALPPSALQHHSRLLTAEGAPPPVRRPGPRHASGADRGVWECDEHGVRRGWGGASSTCGYLRCLKLEQRALRLVLFWAAVRNARLASSVSIADRFHCTYLESEL
jgi:hypothetical protein